MKRLTLALLVLLAFPAGALGATRSGVVLSVDSGRHTVRVVGSQHVVHAYRYRGRLPRLHTGSRIRFRLAAGIIGHVKAEPGPARSVSFYARVLRSSARGLSLRLPDGGNLRFSARQVTRAPRPTRASGPRHPLLAHIAGAPANLAIAIQGLEPGVTVLVTETVDPGGNVTITLTLPAAASPGTGGSQQAGGVVSDVSADGFVLATADGSELRLHAAQSMLANLSLQVCDTVSVTYHQDAEILVADNVQSTGSSTSADCAGTQPTQDLTGTITQVSPSGLSIASAQGIKTFTVASSDITSGFQAGDVVDVTYLQTDASDVEYVEHDATGTVTAVDAGSLTLAGAPGLTFTADPTQGMFDGIAIGAQVDVTYHQSSGGLVADVVDSGG